MIHFYYFQQERRLVVSDLAVDKIKSKYGYNYEILNSIKDKEHVDLIIQRIMKGYDIIDKVLFFHKKKEFSEEYRRKISEAKKGKKRSEEVKARISASRKGQKNFLGKKHTQETKNLMAIPKLGNDYSKDLTWVYDPRGNKEHRVKDLKDAPEGFSKGRDYYSIEGMTMSAKDRSLLRS